MKLLLSQFDGDIFQKMDFKTFIYNELGLNYIEADELIDQLQAGRSRSFDIQPDRKNEYGQSLNAFGLSFKIDGQNFTPAPAKTIAKVAAAQPIEQIIEKPVEKVAEKVAVENIIIEKTVAKVEPAPATNITLTEVEVYYTLGENLGKIPFAKFISEYAIPALSLKEALIWTKMLIDRYKNTIHIATYKVPEFDRQIKARGGRITVKNPPKKTAKKK